MRRPKGKVLGGGGKLQGWEIVKDRGTWHAALHRFVKSRT